MDFLLSLALDYPIMSTIFMIIGALRSINKPLFALLRSLVEATPTKDDDEVLKSVETSKAYTYFTFMLDYFASVKLPQK